jgi:hypothetical protein
MRRRFLGRAADYGWKDGRASLNKVSPVCCFFNVIDGGKECASSLESIAIKTRIVSPLSMRLANCYKPLTIETTEAGYQEAIVAARSLGDICWGLESTGCYGSMFAQVLTASGFTVYEVFRVRTQSVIGNKEADMASPIRSTPKQLRRLSYEKRTGYHSIASRLKGKRSVFGTSSAIAWSANVPRP